MTNQIEVELQGVFGNDRVIANAAWTSSSIKQQKNVRSIEDVERVVNMLADHKHSTPFESIVFRFWIKMPIATDRQFMTHRLQSSNGLSGRYRTMPTEYFDVPDDVMDIIEKLPEITSIQIPGGTMYSGMNDALEAYYQACETANNSYKFFTTHARQQKDAGTITNDEYKRFREFMRGMLPQHNMTERVTTINLRSLANFFKLRLSEHAQPEIRDVAQKMLAAVKTAVCCPVALSALERNGWEI